MGIIRRIIICASVEGIILQSYASPECTKAVRINYGSLNFSQVPKEYRPHDQSSRLEVHGLLGSISVANEFYLVAITKREEVAKIFGKSVYSIQDVALLPLSSQLDASNAIQDASETDWESPNDSDQSSSESGQQLHKQNQDPSDINPANEIEAFTRRSNLGTGIAQNVAMQKTVFGDFASQWLSRRKRLNVVQHTDESNRPPSQPKPAPKDAEIVNDTDQAANSKSERTKASSNAATLGLLPRILRTTKTLLSSGSYFFSYDHDLTHSLAHIQPSDQVLDLEKLDPLYFWNKALASHFLESQYAEFITPIIQGFVGQRAFTLGDISNNSPVITHPEGQKRAVVQETASIDREPSHQNFLLTLISRRSTKRSGLRYLRRGIDDEGNVANFVETEQILSADDFNPQLPIRSFLQIRGSVPVYYSQSPYSIKPAVMLQNPVQANANAFSNHFQKLRRHYGAIQVAVLVNRHGTEQSLGDAYEKYFEEFKREKRVEDIQFEWFDFHAECSGMKFENVSRLVEKLGDFLVSSSETVLHHGKITMEQKGVIRTNCMDCLDRTNVAQSAFAQQHLERTLEAAGYDIDFVKDTSTNWFNILWADNGDAISRLYASTAALKGDFTRTRRRNWRGAMNDFGLTLSRYYSNMVNDYFSQAVIDMLLGSVSWRVFEDFESTMMSTDPGISVRNGREAAIEACSKIVLQDPDNEDLLHAWTMIVPNQENTLRTLPFEEAVVLLTDSAIYCCRMDWTTEKIARYEKVDLRSIRSIKTGVFVTSTFTEHQMDELFNQGLVLYYTPGKEDVIRVNTRSLQTISHDEMNGGQGIDGGTGIMSWMASSLSRQPYHQERIMALKIVLPTDNNDPGSSRAGTPKQIASSIADEIRRAITGSTEHGEQRGDGLVDHADIISVAEAKRRTGYLEQVGQSVRRLVWA